MMAHNLRYMAATESVLAFSIDLNLDLNLSLNLSPGGTP